MQRSTPTAKTPGCGPRCLSASPRRTPSPSPAACRAPRQLCATSGWSPQLSPRRCWRSSIAIRGQRPSVRSLKHGPPRPLMRWPGYACVSTFGPSSAEATSCSPTGRSHCPTGRRELSRPCWRAGSLVSSTYRAIPPSLRHWSANCSPRRCWSLLTDRCAVASRARGDVLAGTAPPVDRFLLIEHRGPWGPAAHPTADLPTPEANALRAAASVLGARVLLIRRPSRQDASTVRNWAVADTRPGRESVAWGTYVAGSLAATTFDAADTTPSTAPVYLVCTQGRHDQCCAIDGRPVAAALALTRPAETWECTHVGGDRFAANLVVL